MLKNLSLFLFSTLLSVYLTEVIIALTLDPLTRVNEKARSYRRQQPGFDRRTILEVLEDERKTGKEVYPFIPLIHLYREKEMDALFQEKTLPLGSIPFSNLILCNENGYFAQVTHDRYGFNNPDSIHDSKIDIIAIGDSFLHGQCVTNGENPIEILRRKFTNIFNLSVSGANPIHELALLKEYGLYTGAKRILWFYFEGNDYKVDDRLSKTILSHYLNNNFSQRLISKSEHIRRLQLNRTKELIAENRELNFHAKPWEFNPLDILKLRNLEEAFKNIFGNKKKKELSPLFIETFEELKRISKEMGLDLTIIYLPDYSRYANDSSLFNHDKHLRRGEILAFFKKLNINVFDFHLILEKKSDPLSYFPYRRFGHYNSAGYELLATAVMKNVLAEPNQ